MGSIEAEQSTHTQKVNYHLKIAPSPKSQMKALSMVIIKVKTRKNFESDYSKFPRPKRGLAY